MLNESVLSLFVSSAFQQFNPLLYVSVMNLLYKVVFI